MVGEAWSVNSMKSFQLPISQSNKSKKKKEKELKGNYKEIRDARKQSGTGWDDSLCMIVVEPSIWDKIIRDHPKVKKFRNKPFPLFNYLAVLYEEPSSDQVISNDNDAHDVGLNPFSTNLEGQATSSAHIEVEEVKHAPSTSSGQKEDDNGKKIKQSQIVGGP